MKIKHAVLILLLLWASGCEEKSDQQTQADRQQVETISVRDVDNVEFKIDTMQNKIMVRRSEGKIVLLDFFASWCAPCRNMIPHMSALNEKYKEDLDIYGISMDDTQSSEDIKSFMRHHKVNYDVWNSPGNFILANKIGGVNTIPLIVLYDREGNYVQHYMGIVSEKMIEEDIIKLIKK
jgi:thiol-disulfide isomerase/thioredoxin